MRRRHYLGAVAGLCAPVAGCLDGIPGTGEQGDRERYETCERRAAVRYAEFPAELQAEVAAVVDGGFTPDDGRIRLDEAVDFETTYVRREGDYYVGRIEDGTLYLEEDAEPTGLDTSRAITVLVRTDATVTLVRDGDVIETFDADEVFTDVVWGGYELQVERESGVDELASLGVGWDAFSAEVTIRAEEVDISQAVLEPAECPWGR